MPETASSTLTTFVRSYRGKHSPVRPTRAEAICLQQDMVRKLTAALLLSLLLLILSGCASSNQNSATSWIPEPVQEMVKNATPDAATPRLSTQSEVVWDQWVRKSDARIYVRPKTQPAIVPNALFFPFRSKMDIRDGKHVSREISRMVWQAWLGDEVFPIIEYADYTDYYTPQRAVALARQRGAELAVGGYVTHYMTGGTVGDTHVALQLEIYDAESGALVWSMAHAGLMQSEFTNDFILFTSRTRLPSDPTWAVVQALSHDMAKPVKAWIEPVKEQTDAENAAF